MYSDEFGVFVPEPLFEVLYDFVFQLCVLLVDFQFGDLILIAMDVLQQHFEHIDFHSWVIEILLVQRHNFLNFILFACITGKEVYLWQACRIPRWFTWFDWVSPARTSSAWVPGWWGWAWTQRVSPCALGCPWQSVTVMRLTSTTRISGFCCSSSTRSRFSRTIH